MARIRNIKPDFWTDEKLVELEPWERLLFIGLWTFADDEGYMPYSPRRIKMQVFPGDSLEVSRGLQNLISSGSLTLYESDAGQVIRITNWIRHQKVSNPSKSKYRHLGLADDEADPLDVGVFGVQKAEKFVKSTEDSRILHKEREGEREGEVIKDLSIGEPIDDKPKRTKIDNSKEFAQWYDQYPRKEAKASAVKAFDKAIKIVSLENLLRSLDGYKRSVAGKERQHIALPATWLNAGRWEDEYGPIENNTGLQVPNQYRMFNQ